MLAQAIAEAVPQVAASSDSPRQDAEILLSHVLGYSRAQLFSRLNDALSPMDAQRYATLIQRRSRGEPVAYLTGEQGFWTLTLQVRAGVLIPRPETELLVEWALERVRDLPVPRIADLGTGSGAIALAIRDECPRAQLIGVDVSAEALSVARANGERLGLPVSWVQADFAEWLTATDGERVDLLVSNPPYIAAHDPYLSALRFEPAVALTDGHDGLNALRVLITHAHLRLAAGGGLLVEHGYDQAPAVRALFAQAGFGDLETRVDLGGHPRVTGGFR